jgi:NHLM bacteriocin system ABC transporter ATP-binding protein
MSTNQEILALHGEPSSGPADPSAESAFGSYLTARGTPLDDAGAVLFVSRPGELILVHRGALDLFAAQIRDGRPVGRWTPLCRIPAGAVLALGAPAGPQHQVIGRPVNGSLLSTVPLAQLQQLSRRAANRDGWVPPDGDSAAPVDCLQAAAECVRGIDDGLAAMERALRRDLPPREFTALEVAEIDVRKGQVLRSVDGVLWVDVLSGSVRGAGAGTASGYAAGDRVCLTELDHLSVREPARLRVRRTGALLSSGELAGALLLHALRLGHALDRAVERQRDSERAALQRQQEQNVRSDRRTELSFNSLLAESTRQRGVVAGPESPVLQVLTSVAHRARVDLPQRLAEPPWESAAPVDDRVLIDRIAASAGIPVRTVRLIGPWWTRDFGPLVGYLRRGGRAVELVPGSRGYLLHDPQASTPTELDKDSAARLRVDATMLYAALPEGTTRIGGLLRFGMRGSRRDGHRFLLTALSVAVIGLLVPVLTGAVLGNWVPQDQRDLVVEGALLIMGSAVVVAALTVVQNTAVLRLEGRVDLTVQAAIWARLLALPMSFFQRYTAAELGTIALGISGVRETLSSVSTIAALGLVTGLVNLLVLFFFSGMLALIAVGMVLLSLLVSLLLARTGIRRQRRLYRAEQRLSSTSYQLLSGLSTLRLAAAEGRAFSQWSRVLTDNVAAALSVRRSQAMVVVFNAGFTMLCSVAVFALVGGPLNGTVSVAAFLAFFTAFNQVLGALQQFCAGAVAVLAVVPMAEGVLPIVACDPEVGEQKASPGELDGSIEVRDVSFRYGGDGPLILDGVSFDVGPGEFVALVGTTGSGKSTVLRLLLGFEEPDTGSVLFDGQDMRRIDVRALRRQCGVVLQNGALIAGDMATNIIAGSGHTIEDAWRAAEAAGIADDIRALPMGMHTVVAEGGSTLSGGQRQRLMIARALISSPRMLFFDEATSALDNQTQRIVAESTRRLNASRLVIAHRLSTVEHADRIVVLQAGRVAQVGSYADLLADSDGAFARLVRRQMTRSGVSSER